jgi:hypothetical protein
MTITVSGDISIIKIETEKILKYKYPKIKVQLMWDVGKNDTIRQTGTISKSFRKYMNNYLENTIPRNYRKQPYWTLSKRPNCLYEILVLWSELRVTADN